MEITLTKILRKIPIKVSGREIRVTREMVGSYVFRRKRWLTKEFCSDRINVLPIGNRIQELNHMLNHFEIGCEDGLD